MDDDGDSNNTDLKMKYTKAYLPRLVGEAGMPFCTGAANPAPPGKKVWHARA